MTTLICFMITDFLLGIIVAGLFHQSPKTITGRLNSHNCFVGIFKKVCELLLVFVGYRLDLTLQLNIIRNAVIYALIANEGISIIENIGLCGVQYPQVIKQALDILNQKANTPIKENDNSNK